MPRVPPITGKADVPAQYHDVVDDVVGVFGQIRGPFSMLLHSPPLAERMLQFVKFNRGGTIVEHLVHWSDKMHSYTYKIVSSPLPVEHYVSTIHVSPAKSGSGSVISWRGHYSAKGASDADAKKAIDGVYDAGLTALAGG